VSEVRQAEAGKKGAGEKSWQWVGGGAATFDVCFLSANPSAALPAHICDGTGTALRRRSQEEKAR
jgi:hypothetical protein